MEQTIVFAIALKPDVKPEQLETYFQETTHKTKDDPERPAAIKSSLYRSVSSPNEFIWTTRFSHDEFNRVTRAAWPMVILEVMRPLRELRERFASDVSIVSSAVLTPDGIVAKWNEEYGRFSKLSLEPASTS